VAHNTFILFRILKILCFLVNYYLRVLSVYYTNLIDMPSNPLIENVYIYLSDCNGQVVFNELYL